MVRQLIEVGSMLTGVGLAGGALFLFLFGPAPLEYCASAAIAIQIVGIALEARAWGKFPALRVPMAIITVAMLIVTLVLANYSFSHIKLF